MDMGRERLTRRLLLHLAIVLSVVGLCVHVYLEMKWRDPAIPLTKGRATQSSWDQQSRTKQESAEQEDKSVKRRISYVRTLKKDSQNNKTKTEAVSLPLLQHRKFIHASSAPVWIIHAQPGSSHLSHAHAKGHGSTNTSSAKEGHRKRFRNTAVKKGEVEKSPRWHIDLEPWASESRSLEDEARRFLKYITTPQVPCLSEGRNEAMLRDAKGSWAVCLDPQYSLVHRISSKNCRVYSFGLGADDWSLEKSLAKWGCDVHCFDPSLKQSHSQTAQMWLHRLSVDWRDPNPAIVAQHQHHANTKKLSTILNDFGHRQVDVLKADMESAEWKILENLILEGVLDSVGQLLLEVHLHWAGFEVPGDEPSVVRFWFSLFKELERANFLLFHVHSDATKPHVFLHKNVLNASSVYTLSWVNTQRT